MSSAGRDTLPSSFTIWMAFIYLFSHLVDLARTSSLMLNSKSESRDSCLDPALRKKAFSHSPLSMMLAVEFS